MGQKTGLFDWPFYPASQIFMSSSSCSCVCYSYIYRKPLEAAFKTLLQHVPGETLASTNRHADRAVVNGVWLLYLQIFRGGRWLRKFKRANRVFFTSAGMNSLSSCSRGACFPLTFLFRREHVFFLKLAWSHVWPRSCEVDHNWWIAFACRSEWSEVWPGRLRADRGHPSGVTILAWLCLGGAGGAVCTVTCQPLNIYKALLLLVKQSAWNLHSGLDAAALHLPRAVSITLVTKKSILGRSLQTDRKEQH